MAPPRKIPLSDVRERALHAFWRGGYDATSLSDLEAATELGRRSLLNTFGSKEGLFLEVLRDFRIFLRERYLAPLLAPDASLAAVCETMDRLVADARTPIGVNGCMVCNTAREPVAQAGPIADEVRAYFAEVEDAFHHALSNAAATGTLPADEDPQRLARALLGQVVSLCVLARAGADIAVLDAIAAEAKARLAPSLAQR